MSPRPRIVRRLRASFFLKILLVFLGGFTAVAAYSMASFWWFDWQREQGSVRRTAMGYGQLIIDELGDPPDTAVARAVASRLGVDLRIEGPGVAWTSSPDVPRPSRCMGETSGHRCLTTWTRVWVNES